MRFMMLLVLILLAGCGHDHDSYNDDVDTNRISLEQYYYSEYEERLQALQLQLQADGYKASQPHAYEHNGVVEWSIYSTVEVTTRDIANEDAKAEKYAERFGVQYDGNGFPMK